MGKPATGRGGVAVESDASAIDGDAVHFRSARLRGRIVNGIFGFLPVLPHFSLTSNTI
jgi:hypothetical protein